MEIIFLFEILLHYFLYGEFSSPTWKKSPPLKKPILTRNLNLTKVPPISPHQKNWDNDIRIWNGMLFCCVILTLNSLYFAFAFSLLLNLLNTTYFSILLTVTLTSIYTIIDYPIWLFQKKQAGLRTYFPEKTLELLMFWFYPWKCQTKQSYNSENSAKLCHKPLAISRQKTKTPGNSA